MKQDIEIRDSRPGDRAALAELYPQAFPDENLLPLLGDLLNDDKNVLSLVADKEGTPVGHVVFTPCEVAGHSESVALLGPLAVTPTVQKQGIGTALVQEGLRRLTTAGCAQVFVLGDPKYYGRFGFEPGSSIAPPHPLPEEWCDAWQSMPLGGAEPALTGALIVPPYWQKPELWSP